MAGRDLEAYFARASTVSVAQMFYRPPSQVPTSSEAESSSQFQSEPERSLKKLTDILNNCEYVRKPWSVHGPTTTSLISTIISSRQSESQPQSQPTFHPFPRLPLEIRIVIWSYAIQSASAEPPSRSKSNPRLRSIVEAQWIDPDHRFHTPASPLPPPFMLVNQESRDIYLSNNGSDHRRPFFGSARGQNAIFFSPATSTVFFRRQQLGSWNATFRYLAPQQLAALESIAFEASLNFINGESGTLFREELYRCTGLKELVLLWPSDPLMVPSHRFVYGEVADDTLLVGRGVHVIQPDAKPYPEGPFQGRTDIDTASCQGSLPSINLTSFAIIIVRDWAAEGRWEMMGRQPPRVKVRHWCFNVRLCDDFPIEGIEEAAQIIEEVVCATCIQLAGPRW